MQRLDKILSDADVASRRELKQMIRAGRVLVNGAAARAPEEKYDPETDEITVDGQPIRRPGPVWLMLHKPAGVVTSTEDPRDKTVLELLPPEYRNLFPVGRLDKATEGLLLLTNDGPAAHRLTSPKYAVEKCYYAEHDGIASAEDAEALAAGVTLRDGTVCRPAKLEILEPGKCLVTVTEGKYHLVRRMLASRGLPVTYLRREREGSLTLGGLQKGAFRLLSEAECAVLSAKDPQAK